MAFPRPNRNNLMRQALNTPARQRLAAMRGQMFPQQNPGLQPPPAPAPRMAAAAAPPPPQQPQAPQRPNRSAGAKSPQNFTPEQRAALQGLSQQFQSLDQGINVTNPTLPPPRVSQQPNRSAAPKPPTNFTPEQRAALGGLSQQFRSLNFTPEQQAALGGLSQQFQGLGQGTNATNPTQPPQSTPPAPVGPGEISPEDVENAPYMSEETLRTNAAETRRLQQQLAAINQQRQALGIGYGLGEFGGDAETNPYSRATLLQRGYERNQRASTNSMAAAGQLYAGSLSNARNFNRFNYDVGYDSMRKQYDAALARLNQQELEAQTRYDDAMEAAMREGVSDGQGLEEPTPEEVPEGQPQGGNQGGGAGARPRKKKVIGASKKRITKARGRIKKLRKARSRAKNPKQRQRITKRIQNNKQTIRNNRKRISNVRQGKPQGQGIKPRPKPKKGKK